MSHLFTTLRLIGVTLFICSIGYTTVIWAIANTLTPWRAQGSLMVDEAGQVIGSRQIAQAFAQPEYFWPRPSAVDYAADAAGGSNLSPANPVLVERLQPLLEAHGASAEHPLPADLATASGAGLDPHISLEAALFQAPRVAKARGIEEEILSDWLTAQAETPGGFLGSMAVVHVLETNIALDRGEVN